MNPKAPAATFAGFDRFKLTPREREILGLLAKGELWKSVAASLQISIHTVHFHTKNICRKCGAGNCFAAFWKITGG